MSPTYTVLLTALGEAKLASATASNQPLQLAKMAVGDGGGTPPTPSRNQTALVGEWYRAPLNTLNVDPSNRNQVIAELVIPETYGGNWIREAGLYDNDGNLIAVANTPPSYKPQLAEGSGRTQVLRLILAVGSASVALILDPSVVLATRQYVDEVLTVAVNRLDFKQSVRVATTTNLTLSGTQTVDGVTLAVGDRVLVKNQDTASQNGLYLVAAGIWSRVLDADTNSEVTPGLIVYVEQGNTQADTLWKLITDAPITLGTSILAFADITSGYAPLKSPVLTGDPRAPKPARFDSDTSIATTDFVKTMGLEFSAIKDAGDVGTILTTDDAGKVIRINLPASGPVVLPVLSTLPTGAALLLKNVSTSSLVVVTPAGADTMLQPLTLPPLCSAVLVARPETLSWLVLGGAGEAFAAVSANVIGQLGLRNRLINPSFYYWQRGSTRSLSDTGNAVYCADRFLCYTGANGACTVSRALHAVGDQLGQTYLAWQQTKAATNNPQLSQRLESVRTLEGRKVTFSLMASTTNVPLFCQIVFRQFFGSGGSPSAPLDSFVGSFTTDGSNKYDRKSLTFDVPSISGKTIGTNGDDFAEILILFPSGATFVFNSWDWQLEAGALATPFEQRPLSLELDLCQRYYETGNFSLEVYGAAGNYSAYWHGFKTAKRVIPSMNINALSYSPILSAPSASSASHQGWQPIAQFNSSGQGGFYGFFMADAEI